MILLNLQVFWLLVGSFELTYGSSLLLTVNRLGLAYFPLTLGLVLFCLRWKIGLVLFAYNSPRLEIGFLVLFARRKQTRPTVSKKTSTVSMKKTHLMV